MRRPVTVRVAAVACLLTAVACAGCSTGPSTARTSPAAGSGSGPTSSHRTSPSATPTAPTGSVSPSSATTAPVSDASPTTPAQIQFAVMNLRERVGQLFMVDCPSTGVSAATRTAITRYHVGSVILDGNSDLGVVRTGTITTALQKLITDGPKLFIATDQEGGEVQRLRGSGFVDIPSALEQGQVDPKQLQIDTTVWGGQLHAAGVNVDLAPVLDTVPANSGPNPPIGDLMREYGHNPGTVSAHGVAVVQGLEAAGVEATAKHFPGLGRVSQNTDYTSGVRDTVTTSDDPYLKPFADAIKAHVPFVMMSTAIYTQLDPKHPAAFSSKIVTGLLRDKLGFKGVVISDDLGNAAQVSGYPVGSRAVRFIAAGGDMVLTVDASQAAAMTTAVLKRAKRDPAFLDKVNAAVLRVLQAKQQAKLLPG
jgi:beta-N-acetylhexosaminidase